MNTTAIKLPRALITGGSGDIGSAICRKLAKSGYQVIIHANKNLKKAEALANELTLDKLSAMVVSFDVCNQDETATAIQGLLENAPIEVLINNAGIHADAIFPAMSNKQWHEVIEVNLHGFFNVTQALILPMTRKRFGRVISISSISAIIGNRGQVNYSAAKAGLHGASKSLALELASRGITVNVVAPGIIASAMTEGVITQKDIEKWVPMRRAGTAAEVASLVAFLASKEASYITGQIISINGGMV